jgi:hypothetical protein
VLEHPKPVNKERERLEKFIRDSYPVVGVVLRSLEESLGLEREVLPGLYRINRIGGNQARVT